jgi:flagellar hook-associated protein 1 FlgK
MIARFHQIDGEINRSLKDAAAQLQSDVNEVNQLTHQIADINSRILALGGSTAQAPDLADQRDQAIDRLSQLIGTRVLPRSDGTTAVLAGDALLVDGSRVQDLSVMTLPGGGYGIATSGGAAVDPQSGSLEALTTFTTTTLPGIRAKLDQLAQAMVTDVNAIHQTGFTQSGATNTNFFDPAGVTAGTIKLSAAIQADPGEIAAGSTAAPGDNSVALKLAALARTGSLGLGGATMRDFYADLAGSVGSAVSDAADTADIQSTLVSRADMQRSSISGVSIDEEMTNLISQQEAYSAAARLIRVADDMMQDLMNLISA